MADARPHDMARGSARWTYQRAEADGIVELGTVQGRDVALPAHFHDEDQITIVRSGRRRFCVGGAVLTVEAGGCAVIPAGVVHWSLAEPAAVDGLNLYVPAGDDASSGMVAEIARPWCRGASLEPAAAMSVVRRHRLRSTNATRSADPRCSVAERAACAGISREAFSRAFAQQHGMPPHAFGMIVRLNHARRLLRSGVPIVAAAVDAGFADQSHLGRCFRRTFGVTPGQYRCSQDLDALQTSQTFQTRR